jgi:hypothetical protein
VENASSPLTLSVMPSLDRLTCPGTTVDPDFRIIVEVLMVAGSIFSEKKKVTGVDI